MYRSHPKPVTYWIWHAADVASKPHSRYSGQRVRWFKADPCFSKCSSLLVWARTLRFKFFDQKIPFSNSTSLIHSHTPFCFIFCLPPCISGRMYSIYYIWGQADTTLILVSVSADIQTRDYLNHMYYLYVTFMSWEKAVYMIEISLITQRNIKNTLSNSPNRSCIQPSLWFLGFLRGSCHQIPSSESRNKIGSDIAEGHS